MMTRVASAFVGRASCRRHFAQVKFSSWRLLASAGRAADIKFFSEPAWKLLVIGKPCLNFHAATNRKVCQERAMSVFGKIMSAIFGTKADAAPGAGGTPAAGGTATPASGSSPAAGGSPAGSGAPAQSVDVASILDKAVAAKKEKLEWRTSIVDLMKALDIDSSLSARKELAKELGYTGNTNDSAGMNVWLHKQVMAKLAANGGKLPADIKW
jgi:Domain of unknown function (DUF3597)